MLLGAFLWNQTGSNQNTQELSPTIPRCPSQLVRGACHLLGRQCRAGSLAKASDLQGGLNLTLGWSSPSRVPTGLLWLLPRVSWRLRSCSHKQTCLIIGLRIWGWLARMSHSSPYPVHVLGPGRVLTPLPAVLRDGLRDSKRNQAENHKKPGNTH